MSSRLSTEKPRLNPDIMYCCLETAKISVPARHRPPEAESGEAGGPPWQSRGTRDRSQGPTPEDARKDGHIIRPRSAQSRKRVPSFAVRRRRIPQISGLKKGRPIIDLPFSHILKC
ncbi:MAG: hypothetical protein PVH35_06825, partial [Syntrophobacterales bacterium]